MNPALKAVLFDFGGTLDSDGVHWRARFRSLYIKSGLDVPEPEFRRAFYEADDGLAERFDLSRAGFEETVRLQTRSVVKNLGENAALADAVADAFVKDSKAFFERNRPLLDRLAKRFRLGIVSNNYGNMEAILASEGLDRYFSVVADSTRVGAVKPDRRLFLHATSTLGIRPEEALMVGDSIPRDMKGAEALGMPHAWLRGLQDPGALCCAGAFVLDSLTGLEAMVTGSEVGA